MSHEQLWAPWRLSYIAGDDPPPEKVTLPQDKLLAGADVDCFICQAVAQDRDEQNLVVARHDHCISILNRYPYNNGHVLISPLNHKGHVRDLTDEEHLDCQREITRLVVQLERTINAQGFNVGLNLGHIAGAGLPGHLHWHIVPRWSGDTNFMPVLAGIKTIPQSLESLWELLTTGTEEGSS